jgi:RNA polymerase sigma-70 factor (ECF subfamily)
VLRTPEHRQFIDQGTPRTLKPSPSGRGQGEGQITRPRAKERAAVGRPAPAVQHTNSPCHGRAGRASNLQTAEFPTYRRSAPHTADTAVEQSGRRVGPASRSLVRLDLPHDLPNEPNHRPIFPDILDLVFESRRPGASNPDDERQIARGSNKRRLVGDTSNLDRLVLAHLPAALRFATRMTGDPDAAEDLVQQALARVAEHFGTFRGEAEFRTWFFRILINVFRDRLRRRLPAVVSLDDESLDVPDRNAPEPAETVAAAELGQLIAAEVSRLPPRQREVLVLIAFEELSTAQTATLLGITEQNVHSTLSAARARLKERLAPYLGFVEQ